MLFDWVEEEDDDDDVRILQKNYFTYWSQSRVGLENTQCRRKDHSTAGLQFHWIGFDQIRKYVVISMY